MLTLTHGTSAEFTAALARPGVLKPGGQFATFTLAGEFERSREDGTPIRTVFYQPCVAAGRLAGRLGTLGAGEAISGTGVLAAYEGEIVIVVQDAARLPSEHVRLELDGGGAARLLRARWRVRARGVLITPPQAQRLENEVPVTNIRLGLTPKRAEGTETQLVPLELAAYGELAVVLAGQGKGNYLDTWGVLQRRQGAQRRFSRLEVQDVEPLHGTRALL